MRMLFINFYLGKYIIHISREFIVRQTEYHEQILEET